MEYRCCTLLGAFWREGGGPVVAERAFRIPVSADFRIFEFLGFSDRSDFLDLNVMQRSWM